MNWLKQLTPEQIRSQLNLPQEDTTNDIKPDWDTGQSSQAAVLIPFFYHQQQWHLLFIRRSQHEDDLHSGQVAFAGGKREASDADLVETALREAEEEIGLLRQHVDVLGKLSIHHSTSRFRITPVVANIPWPYRLRPDQREVARVFSIPLQWLAEPGHHSIRNDQQREGGSFPVVYYEQYDGEVLWGATARMTLSLIARLRNY
jgi:8-oxo-dGTP pyrophosphatase MutT (NUDIX family)